MMRFYRDMVLRPIFWGSISMTMVLYFVASCCNAAEFVDDDGSRIVFNTPFRRIISLYPAHTENLLFMGDGEHIVGISRGCRNIPGTMDMQIFSASDDPERLLAVSPDLVLIRPMISRSHPAFVEMLRKNHVTVVSLQPISIEGMQEYWLRLGMLSGRKDAAEKMWRLFQEKVSDARKKVAGIPISSRKKVYFESMHSRMKSFAPGSIAMFVLETAGGINAIPDLPRVRNTNIAYCGMERLLSHADEIDVYLAQHGRMNRVSVDDIINTPGFNVIKAVRERQVWLIPERLVARPTMNIVSGIQMVMNILYGLK